MVVVAAVRDSLADELKRAADRVWIIDPTNAAEVGDFPPLQRGGKI
jgi:hypothetical protein